MQLTINRIHNKTAARIYFHSDYKTHQKREYQSNIQEHLNWYFGKGYFSIINGSSVLCTAENFGQARKKETVVLNSDSIDTYFEKRNGEGMKLEKIYQQFPK